MKNEKNSKLAEALARQAEMLNDLQRTRADFENFRKQVEIQKEQAKAIEALKTVMKILPLIDDVDRAILAQPKELGPISKSFEKTLRELKLEKIDTSRGVEFNPDLHEAVAVEGEGEKEVISETLRSGFLYEGQVIRAAMVKVEKV